MAFQKGVLCLFALALLVCVSQAASGSAADNAQATSQATTVNTNGENAAALSDFDGDGTVGFFDFVIFAGVFGARQGDGKYEATYDLNGDGEIGFSDFVIFAQNFGKQAPSPVVAIPDANLRAAIEDALNKAGGAPITQAEMATLDSLEASDADIADLTGLEFATNLTWLDLASNNITNISVLEGLANLTHLILSGNDITDLAGLVANSGLGTGDIVDLTDNPLNVASQNTHIPALQARGIGIAFDEIVVFTAPQIYNGNVFVLPVEENLGALWTDLVSPPLQDYTASFYEHFNDEFDFLILVANVNSLQPGGITGGFYASVKNDVQGIGLPIFANNGSWGSTGKLQGVVFISYYQPYHPTIGYSAFRQNLLQHELMHRWANFIVPSSYGSHWGFMSPGGVLSPNISEIIDHGGGKFSAIPSDRSKSAYAPATILNPIELYLAGFIPPENVPNFQIAEDAKWFFQMTEDLNYLPAEDDAGYSMFTASRVTTYTIKEITAEHGQRVPDDLEAQKHFRAAVILLVSEAYPATRQILESVRDDVLWFSRASEEEIEKDDILYTNFYGSTGGRGTITMDGLSQFQRSAGSKITLPNSFGTPPPPVVDHWDVGNGPENPATNLRHIPAQAEQPR